MNFARFLTVHACLLLSASAYCQGDWIELFDGKTLENWDGDPELWSVEDGAITGRTTDSAQLKANSFLVYRGGQFDNFELELEYKIVGGNSGIQYRSFELPNRKWGLGGYQADFEAGDKFSGILYGEQFRGILGLRGEVAELVSKPDGGMKKLTVDSLGESAEIQKKIRKEDWNKYRIVASNFRFQHFINDTKTVEVVDNHLQKRRATGLLGLQIHRGPPMTVQFRNIRIKKLPAPKKVALIAGTKSHGYGAHEHRAGCLLLAKALNKSGLVDATVYSGGWPKDDRFLDHCDAIVIYCDGGKRHPFNNHLDRLRQIQSRGVGLVCLHYGVEVPKGPSGQAFLDWTGGYFETDWSVNPHWTGTFKDFPEHEITHGVTSFTVNDEWYYHMRFTESADELTPILSDLPPSSTLVKADGSLSRNDGPHHNNPFVRAAVLERKENQHVAWARQRKDGGRGFGFTGGHFHWNWANRGFRTVVLNAIVWSAHVAVPKNGVPSDNPTVDDLMANQDFPVPSNFNKARIAAMLQEWSQ